MASSESPITPLSLLMTKDDFDRPNILNAANPHPESGYAHGPVPNNNRGWIPQSVVDRSVKALQPFRISAVDIAEGLTSNPPPNPMVKLNKENGLGCDVEMSLGILCGKSYNTWAELRKHLLRNQHPRAIEAITACRKSLDDMTNGIDALKRWCLTGGWRQANHYHEPGYALKNSLFRQFCDALERIA
ncbi:hypothetical protein PoHVEF18_008290 [Penicillium ochrochloron]